MQRKCKKFWNKIFSLLSIRIDSLECFDRGNRTGLGWENSGGGGGGRGEQEVGVLRRWESFI